MKKLIETIYYCAIDKTLHGTMEQYIQPQSRFKVILGDPVLLSCSGKPLKYLTFGNYPGTLKDLKYP